MLLRAWAFRASIAVIVLGSAARLLAVAPPVAFEENRGRAPREAPSGVLNGAGEQDGARLRIGDDDRERAVEDQGFERAGP